MQHFIGSHRDPRAYRELGLATERAYYSRDEAITGLATSQSPGDVVTSYAEFANEVDDSGNAVPSASGPCGSHDEPSHASCATHDCCVGHNTSECQNTPAEPAHGHGDWYDDWRAQITKREERDNAEWEATQASPAHEPTDESE